MHANKTILVSGAAGFIGSHLCKALLDAGYKVIGVDDYRRGSEQALRHCLNASQFRFINSDISQIAALGLDGIDTVIHLASSKIPRYTSGWEVIEGNRKSNEAVLEYCIKQNIRLLFASTSDVYGKNPHPPFTEAHDCVLGSTENKRWAYAASKLHMEHALFAAGREFGLSFQIMRFFGCYGPGMAKGWWGGPQSVFLDQALKGEAFEIHGDGLQTRSYVYINDLVEMVLLLTENDGLESGIWNICAAPETAVSVIELAGIIQSLVNPDTPPKFNFVPYTTFGVYEDVRHRSGSAHKAKEQLGWEAKVGLKTGLQRSIEELLKERNSSF